MKARVTISFVLLYNLTCIAVAAHAQNNTDSLLNILQHSSKKDLVTAYYHIGDAYYLRGMNDSASYYFNLSLQQAEQQDNMEATCAAYLAIAKCNIHLQHLDVSLELLFKTITVSEKNNLPKQTANAKYIIAIVYEQQGRYEESLKFGYDAEKTFRQLKDTNGLISVYPAIITASGRLNDTAATAVYFRGGLDLFNRYAKSSALPAAEKRHLPLKKMALIFNAVNFMHRNEDFLLAGEEVDKIAKEINDSGNPYEQFERHTLSAMIGLRLKNYKTAQLNAEKAVSFIRPESGNYSELCDVYQIIAEASAGLGEFDKAYNASLVFKEYKDSLYKFSTLEAVHTVEAKYETAKKEEQIMGLRKQRKGQRVLIISVAAGLMIALALLLVALRAKRLQVKLSATEKEQQKNELEKKMLELEQTALRAQMNPHFIFNSLNSVQRFLINNDTKGVNEYLATFASLIRYTLENSGKAMISLGDEINYLDTYIRLEQMRSQYGFKYELNLGEHIEKDNIYLPGMIIQPFVENSIQYGVNTVAAGEGRLRLSAEVTGAELVITVEDNGPGMQKNISKPHTHVSMGSAITQKRIELYNSGHNEKIKLEIQDKSLTDATKTGTLVKLRFPVKQFHDED